MKTMKNATIMLMLVGLFLSGSDVQSQGRSNGSGKSHERHEPGREEHVGISFDKNHNRSNAMHKDNDQDRYGRSHVHASREDYRYNRHYASERHVIYRHHRQAHPSWAPVYGYRYNTRYIYYQDYHVYYDCDRNMFLTWTGRRWVVSNRIPDVMLRVDFRRTRVSGVDYWDDDLDFYLQRRRPAYLTITAAF